MVSVLTICSEEESAKNLGYPVFLDEEAIDENDLVIRWGHGFSLRPYDFDRVANPRKAIGLNVNKNKAHEVLSSVVLTPQIYKVVPKGKLAVVRPTRHSGGSGFRVRKGPYTPVPGEYAMEFISTDVEYRVWFALDRTMSALRKTINPELLKPKYKCRSGWPYVYTSTPKQLHDATLVAAKAIGLHFGAADVLYKDGKYYFLELNSAPSIDHWKVEGFFKEQIKRLEQNENLYL